ncbi:MAG: hypothetical protein JKY01_09790 [Pseudomonadales bacterium]|nr:hypothetical protein [Pseudomonadales bacterium]
MLAFAIMLVFMGTGYAGYLLSTSHKRNTKPLDFLRTVHRFGAILGLVCFGIYLLTNEGNTLLTAGFVLFLVTLLAGFTLFRGLYPQQQKPMMLIYIHASAAITALLTTTIGFIV